MTFESFWKNRPRGIYTDEDYARLAWEASAKNEREACIKAIEEIMIVAVDENYDGQADAVRECLSTLRERSNAALTGAPETKEK